MNKLIPFKKDIIFKTKIFDITSISLEHKSDIKNKSIFLEFLINGDYKMTEASINKEKFEYSLPFEVDIDEKYNISNVSVDVDDFYYEIINNEILRVNIAILLENLEITKKEEKKKLEEFSENNCKTILDIDEEYIDESDKFSEEDNIRGDEFVMQEEKIKQISEIIFDEENYKLEENNNNKNDNKNDNKIINSIFSNLSDGESFKTYHIYIMQEEDTIEKVMLKYSVSKDIIDEYNNLDNVKIGDKIIIPNIN